MKIRSNLQAGAQLCPQANLWRRRAEVAAAALLDCKKEFVIPSPYNPVVVYPGVINPLPYGAGGGETVVGSYDGRDYSGYCG